MNAEPSEHLARAWNTAGGLHAMRYDHRARTVCVYALW